MSGNGMLIVDECNAGFLRVIDVPPVNVRNLKWANLLIDRLVPVTHQIP